MNAPKITKYDHMVKAFTKEIESSYDWKSIHAELDFLPTEDCQKDDFDATTIYPEIFIETVFTLSPSGKYYTSFACSNITDHEAEKDSAFYEALENVLDTHNLYYTSGEDDPCDIFFGKTRTIPSPEGEKPW